METALFCTGMNRKIKFYFISSRHCKCKDVFFCLFAFVVVEIQPVQPSISSTAPTVEKLRADFNLLKEENRLLKEENRILKEERDFLRRAHHSTKGMLLLSP